MAYIYAACTVHFTIFSTGGKFWPVSNFGSYPTTHSEVLLVRLYIHFTTIIVLVLWWLCTSHVLLNLLQAAATRRDPAAATVAVASVSAGQVLDKIKTKVGHWDSPPQKKQVCNLYSCTRSLQMQTWQEVTWKVFMPVGREEAGHALTHSSCDSAYPPKKLKIMSYQRYNRVYKTITKYRITIYNWTWHLFLMWFGPNQTVLCMSVLNMIFADVM